MQQCEWKAMVQRLNELGVKLPNDLLKDVSHADLITLMNLYYEKNESAGLQDIFDLLLKMNTKYYKALEQMYSFKKENKSVKEEMSDIQLLIDRQEKELEKVRNDLKKTESNVLSLNKKLDSVYKSYSWKLGHAVTSGASLIYKVIPKLSPKGGREIKNAAIPEPQHKVNLGEELTGDYGKHRSGWAYAISSLEPLHNPEGVLLDSFIERTFVWHPEGVRPHLEPWIGFIHIPPIVPKWFGGNASNQSVFSTSAWKESLPYCKGLFTLSAYHKKQLETQLDIPINNLLHPTEDTPLKWDWNKFRKNKEKKVIQIGYWLRKLLAIYALEAPGDYQKCFIRKENVNLDNLLGKEKEKSEYKDLINERTWNSVKPVSFLSNNDYDQLLTESIVFMDLYDASANNSIIECIVRNTPILINPIEPVVEYLGKDYPFYFNNLQEASEKLQNMDLIKETHSFLVNHPVKKKLTASYFLKSFVSSPIYRNL